MAIPAQRVVRPAATGPSCATRRWAANVPQRSLWLALCWAGAGLSPSTGAAASAADHAARPAGLTGHVLAPHAPGGGSMVLHGSAESGLRLEGVVGLPGTATLRSGTLVLEGGVLHGLPRPDALFADGFEESTP